MVTFSGLARIAVLYACLVGSELMMARGERPPFSKREIVEARPDGGEQQVSERAAGCQRRSDFGEQTTILSPAERNRRIITTRLLGHWPHC